MAHGGQIAVPLDVAQAFVRHCTGRPATFTVTSLAEPPSQLQAGAIEAGSQPLSPQQSLPTPLARQHPAPYRQASLGMLQSHGSGKPLTGLRRQAPGTKEVMPAGEKISGVPLFSNPLYQEGEVPAQQPSATARLQPLPALRVDLSPSDGAELPGLQQRTDSGLRSPQGVPALQVCALCVLAYVGGTLHQRLW